MDFAISPGGLTVHNQKDWPCAVCRPDRSSEGRGYCLCRSCAKGMLIAAAAGVEGARELLNEVTDAMAMLEYRPEAQTLPI